MVRCVRIEICSPSRNRVLLDDDQVKGGDCVCLAGMILCDSCRSPPTVKDVIVITLVEKRCISIHNRLSKTQV